MHGSCRSRPEFSTSMARRDDSTEWAHSGGFMGSLSAKQRRVVRETIAECVATWAVGCIHVVCTRATLLMLSTPTHTPLVARCCACAMRSSCRDERSGAFRRIFPSAQAYTYRKFFEEVRPLNDLLADHLFHITAQVGVAHAMVSPAPDVWSCLVLLCVCVCASVRVCVCVCVCVCPLLMSCWLLWFLGSCCAAQLVFAR